MSVHVRVHVALLGHQHRQPQFSLSNARQGVQIELRELDSMLGPRPEITA